MDDDFRRRQKEKLDIDNLIAKSELNMKKLLARGKELSDHERRREVSATTFEGMLTSS